MGGINRASMTLTKRDFSMRNMSWVSNDGERGPSSFRVSSLGPYNWGTVKARNRTIQTSYKTRDSSDRNTGRKSGMDEEAAVYCGYTAMQNSLSKTEGSSRWTAQRESWES